MSKKSRSTSKPALPHLAQYYADAVNELVDAHINAGRTFDAALMTVLSEVQWSHIPVRDVTPLVERIVFAAPNAYRLAEIAEAELEHLRATIAHDAKVEGLVKLLGVDEDTAHRIVESLAAKPAEVAA